MNKINLVIHGTPQPKQSVRSGVVYGKDGQPVKFIDKNTGKERVLQTKFQPKKSVENEKNIKLEVLSQLPQGFKPFAGPIRVNKLHFVFPPLKTFSKKKMKLIEMGEKIYKDRKPDLMDNLNKGLFDALEGIVFLNDSQIVSSNNLEKYFGLQPRIELELEELNQESQSHVVQNGGLAPCDCKDEQDLKKLKEVGIKHNNDSLTVNPNHVTIQIDNCTYTMSQRRFKQFAEWYLAKQY